MVLLLFLTCASTCDYLINNDLRFSRFAFTYGTDGRHLQKLRGAVEARSPHPSQIFGEGRAHCSLGAFPHARMETEDPISAQTGPTLQSESELYCGIKNCFMHYITVWNTIHYITFYSTI